MRTNHGALMWEGVKAAYGGCGVSERTCRGFWGSSVRNSGRVSETLRLMWPGLICRVSGCPRVRHFGGRVSETFGKEEKMSETSRILSIRCRWLNG